MKRQRVEVFDDLDESLIEDGKGGTVTFAWGGVEYEMDLSEKNQGKLDKLLKPYVEKARRAPKKLDVTPGRGRSGKAAAAATPASQTDIRAWARENGFEVSERGRLSSDIVTAYEQRHAQAS